MKIKIDFPTVFIRMSEGREFRPSFIAYGKFEWKYDSQAGMTYEHRLYINLWAVEIKIGWYSNDKKPS